MELSSSKDFFKGDSPWSKNASVELQQVVQNHARKNDTFLHVLMKHKETGSDFYLYYMVVMNMMLGLAYFLSMYDVTSHALRTVVFLFLLCTK